MEQLNGKKVVVIGTGIGGSGIAPLLAKEGAEVTVLERNDFPGGKAASFEREGFVYDTGVHWIARGEKGPLGEIADIVGAEVRFESLEPAMLFTAGEKTATLYQNMDEDEALDRLFEEIGVEPGNRSGAKAFFKDILRERSPEELKKLDHVSLSDYMQGFVEDEQLNRLIDGFAGMYLVISRRATSASEFIICFSTQTREKRLSYPIGAMRAVPIAYLDALEKMGGEVRYSVPVERILLEDGKVRGVEAGGFIPADLVVSNTGVKETVDLAGRHNFPDDYLAMVDSLRLSFGAVSVKYALDTELVEHHLMCYFPDFRDEKLVERQASIFVPVPTAADPSLAPAGCQLVLAGSLAPPGLDEPEQADEVCQAILDRVEATMQDLYPDIEKHVVWKIRTNTQYIANISGRGSGEVIGVAQNRHQVGDKRPSQFSPIEGLCFVGADAGGRGIGTEMAADSVLNLWRTLRNK
ncbi:MAG: phytoene desaturase family protein [Actinomycetota bacterium]